MNIRRTIGIAALGAAATSLAIVPAAGAQEAEGYGASSSGEALDLTVFGQGLTVGRTMVEIDDTPMARASGAGVATPAFEAGATTADTTQGQGGDPTPTCEGPIDQIPGLSIALACSSSVASVDDGAPTATATGTVGEVVVNPVQALLDTPLADAVAPVEDGLGQLLGALEPVTGPLGEAGLDVDGTLQDLFDALFQGADLVTITLGDTTSNAAVTTDNVAASCLAEGARIDVLGAETLGLAPVLSIIVGEAETSVVALRSGEAEPTATVRPSLVTVVSPLLPEGSVEVAVGESIEIPLPEPFGPSVISVADGATGTEADEQGNESTYATANAVGIDLLNGEAFMGGIELALAGCSSAVGHTPIQLPSTPLEEEPQLPRTGSDGPNHAALAAAVGLGGLGLALVRRTRSTH